MNSTTTTPQELHERIRGSGGIVLIDVRTPIEFREFHIAEAENVPLDNLEPEKLASKLGGKAKTVHLICRTGGRAAQACRRLIDSGFIDVVNVEGGMLAWEAAGLPVDRNREVMSLERQVRIAAGSLVLIGSLLGFFVHPYWIALSAFVGAGLVFAGLTNTCGMGLLLAKMPWNKGDAKTCDSESRSR